MVGFFNCVEMPVHGIGAIAMKKYLIAALFILTLAPSAYASPEFFWMWARSTPAPSGPAYIRTLTVDHTKVPNTDQAYFPVLVSLTDATLKTVANSGHVQNASGYDVEFWSDSGHTTKLDYEVERYNASTGELIVWVKIPTLSHTADTVFYMTYDDSSVSAFQGNVNGTWDDGGSNYNKLVWHLPNGTSLSANDSTSNAQNGTFSTSPPTATTGQIDGGGSFNGSTQYISKTSPTVPTGTTTRTMSCWFKKTATTSSVFCGYGPNSSGSDTFFLYYYTGYSNLWLSANASLLKIPWTYDTNMHYLAATLPSGTLLSNCLMYLDGSPATVTVVTDGTLNTVAGNFTVGVRPDIPGGNNWCMTGTLDEIHLSSTARSADWIKTEWNNQSSPGTFITLGTETGL